MNHFDDRRSYFAFLAEQGWDSMMQMLDNNAQQDISLRTYGGDSTKSYTMLSDMQQDI